MEQRLLRKNALRFVILIGIVSLFADMTYEGARGVAGPYLGLLGASATVIGVVAGLGEFLGYGLRLISGYIVDKTAAYWKITFLGYFINLISVPLLALTHHWLSAAILLVLERIGKAIRNPARDAMLSHAGQNVGMGWAFGLHEALDQIGAMTGPLLLAFIFYLHGTYQQGFAALLVPAVLALTVLTVCARLYPHPRDLEKINPQISTEGYSKSFWIYLIATSFIAIGYVDFPLMAFHLVKIDHFQLWWIPLAYALAMGINGLVAPLLGFLFDRFGVSVILALTFISLWFAPLVFFGHLTLEIIGLMLWSIGISGQQTMMRALIGKMINRDQRASAYGLFNVCFGFSWFIGSAAVGLLYTKSIVLMVSFSVFWQLLALPLLGIIRGKLKS